MALSLSRQLKIPHFGLHVTIDAYGCSSDVLKRKSASRGYLNAIVKKLKMRKLYGPMVVDAPGNGHKDPGGNSGFVIIQESHISLHTFPRRKFVSIDIYSCNDFDFPKAIAFTKKYYQARSLETYTVVRGRRYPKKNLL